MKISAPKIRYEEGDWKYRLDHDWEIQTPIVNAAARIIDPDDPSHPWIELTQDGVLKIKEGYCWDGASGPTIDVLKLPFCRKQDSMRASLVHDALYQLERSGHLGQEWRPVADQLLCDICIADGFWPWRARTWLFTVRKFAAGAAARREPVILEAP